MEVVRQRVKTNLSAGCDETDGRGEQAAAVVAEGVRLV